MLYNLPIRSIRQGCVLLGFGKVLIGVTVTHSASDAESTVDFRDVANPTSSDVAHGFTAGLARGAHKCTRAKSRCATQATLLMIFKN